MKLRKKILAVALIGAMLLLGGCGSNSNASSASSEGGTKKAAALNLTGSWIAETKGSDYYLAGFIKGDIIELHWVSDYDQNGSVYWAGTYVPPKDKPDTYTWESQRNDAIMNTSAYASVDEARTFTYADGKLTLAASNTGVETVLVPADSDYTYLEVKLSKEEKKAAEEAAKAEEKAAKEAEKAEKDAAKAAEEQQASQDAIAAAATEETKNIEVVNTGYSVENVGAGNSLVYYAVEMRNPNKYNAIISPNIEVTVRDSDGRILTKQNRSLFAVAPEDTINFGDAINCPKGSPDKVEINVKNNDYDFKTFEGSGIHSVKDFKVSDVKEDTSSGDQVYYTGKLKNTSDDDLGGVVATVVFKKEGKIVGGVTGQIGTVVAGDTTTFNIAAKSGFSDYDSYDVYVTQEPA